MFQFHFSSSKYEGTATVLNALKKILNAMSPPIRANVANVRGVFRAVVRIGEYLGTKAFHQVFRQTIAAMSTARTNIGYFNQEIHIPPHAQRNETKPIKPIPTRYP